MEIILLWAAFLLFYRGASYGTKTAKEQILFLLSCFYILYYTKKTIFPGDLYFKKQRKDYKRACNEKKQHTFFAVSKRARAAYMILCLEEILKFYHQDFLKWQWILQKLWQVTATKNMAQWVREMYYVLFDAILKYDCYEAYLKSLPADIGFAISQKEFYNLKNIYMAVDVCFPLFKELLYDIYIAFEVGLACGEMPHDISFLYLIERTQQLLKTHHIPLPQQKKALSFLMQQKNKYYGKPFCGFEYSFLRQTE